MSFFQNPLFYAVLMLAAGLGIPVMAALNSGLGARLNNPALATVILFVVGSVVAASYLFISGSAIKVWPQQSIPTYFFLGGFFVVFYILSITWVIPKFGVANAIAFVLLGQLISMATIDHFGLLGAPQYVISYQRLLGLVLIIAGVFLAVKRT
ncbi:MAG: DMT family transporter [Kangiellaceae bacterium]|nr:DMT family transporter [Kangiellaceae bacterium]